MGGFSWSQRGPSFPTPPPPPPSPSCPIFAPAMSAPLHPTPPPPPHAPTPPNPPHHPGPLTQPLPLTPATTPPHHPMPHPTTLFPLQALNQGSAADVRHKAGSSAPRAPVLLLSRQSRHAVSPVVVLYSPRRHRVHVPLMGSNPGRHTATRRDQFTRGGAMGVVSPITPMLSEACVQMALSHPRHQALGHNRQTKHNVHFYCQA